MHPGLDNVIEQMNALEAWEKADPNARDAGAVGAANAAADGAEVAADGAEWRSML